MMSQTTLNKKHIVITGGGRGIGAAVADSLSAAGATITIMGRTQKTLEDKARTLPNCLPVICDVTDEMSVSEAFVRAKKINGPVDILINNAGEALGMPFLKTGRTDLQHMLDINLIGPTLCIAVCLPDMIGAGAGHIINIASTAALRGYGYATAYSAAKHGLLGLTRSLALEMAENGIRVNAVCPDFTDTSMVQEAVKNIMTKTGRTKAAVLAELTKDSQGQRLLTPEEVAATILWLCCGDKGASCSGEVIMVGQETHHITEKN